MSDAAATLFRRLLAAHERAGGVPSRAIGEPYPTPSDIDERDALARAVAAAERAGAVTLRRGKGFASHLVERVYLADADALYAVSGEETADARRDAILAALGTFVPETPEGREALDLVRDGHAAKRTVCGIRPGETERAVEALRVLDAVHARQPSTQAPLRAFSTASFGDSKLVARSWRRVCLLMRELDLAQPEATESDEDIAIRLGLRRALPLVHLAGPLACPGLDLAQVGLVGLTGEAALRLDPTGRVSGVLTVENWESFRRHVDEARSPAEVVVYSGGWPSRAVAAALARLAHVLDCPFHHWGDIDPAGVRIGQAVSDIVGGAAPHLMDPDLAEARGVAGKPSRPPPVPAGSPFGEVAAYLATKGHRTLEQEILDPSPVRR